MNLSMARVSLHDDRIRETPGPTTFRHGFVTQQRDAASKPVFGTEIRSILEKFRKAYGVDERAVG